MTVNDRRRAGWFTGWGFWSWVHGMKGGEGGPLSWPRGNASSDSSASVLRGEGWVLRPPASGGPGLPVLAGVLFFLLPLLSSLPAPSTPSPFSAPGQMEGPSVGRTGCGPGHTEGRAEGCLGLLLMFRVLEMGAFSGLEGCYLLPEAAGSICGSREKGRRNQSGNIQVK